VGMSHGTVVIHEALALFGSRVDLSRILVILVGSPLDGGTRWTQDLGYNHQHMLGLKASLTQGATPVKYAGAACGMNDGACFSQAYGPQAKHTQAALLAENPLYQWTQQHYVVNQADHRFNEYLPAIAQLVQQGKPNW